MSEEIKKELNNEKGIICCAEQFGLVGDPTRMKICWLLCHHEELSVGDIAKTLNVSVSVVSHSLKKLKKYEMVKTRREHRQIFYHLSQNDFNKTLKDNLIKI